MKLHIRIFSTLLALLMTLGAFTAFTILEVGAAETEDDIKKRYTAKVYNTPEERLNDGSMKLMLESNGYQLWVEDYTGEIAVVDKTGSILFSNPYDLGSANSSTEIKAQLLSQISVQYIENGKTNSMYSFAEAAVRNQIKVSSIKNGVRVEYSIGREEARKLVPRWISKENFEKFIKNPMIEAVEKGELDAFWADKVYDKFYGLKSLSKCKSEKAKQQLILEYPICEVMDIYVFLWNDHTPSLNIAESYIKIYCEDYSYEQMDADHEETGYPAVDETYPLFKMALEYSLDENGLVVSMPCNGLRYDTTTYPVESISILPYMGAGNGTNPGYTFFPDGAGSLFEYKDLSLREHIAVQGKIYGADFAYHNVESTLGTYQKTIRYPVYGAYSTEVLYTYQYTEYDPTTKTTSAPITTTVSNTVKSLDKILAELENENITQISKIETTTYTKGYVAIIEEGDSLGSLQVYAPGGSMPYNTVRNFFDPKPRDSYVITDSSSTSGFATWGVTSNRKYTGNITIRYQMLHDVDRAEQYKAEVDPTFTYYETNWLGMAEAYRDYLASEKVGVLKRLTEQDVENDVPMYIETFGAMLTQSSFLTIPVQVMTPFTTFEDVETMYTELSKHGVNNINFKLNGYANGGIYATVPAKLKWEKNVGGANGFRSLIAAANAVNADENKNFGIYPDFDFAYANADTLSDKTAPKKDFVRTIDGRYTTRRMYSATQQKYVSFYQMAMSPSRYEKFYTKLLKNYSEYDIKSMSLSTLGNALNSDFDEDDPFNREESKEQTMAAFADFEAAGYSLMSDSGNAYSWKYVDHLINMDLDSSRYVKASASIPFIGAVLHGYVQFAGTPFNEEGDTDYAILKAIENGAGLYFILSYRNTDELKKDLFMSQYYSVRYDIWYEDMIGFYNKLNDAMKDVQTSVIVDHYFINDGVRIPDLDELEADIQKQIEDALAGERDKAQNELTDKLVSIADARTSAALLGSNLKNSIEEMQSLNYALDNVVSGYYTKLSGEKAAIGRFVGRLLPVLAKYEGDITNEEVISLTDELVREIGYTKNYAVMALKTYFQIQQCKEDAEAMVAEAEAAIDVIRRAQEVNPALSDALVDQLVAEAEAYIADAKEYLNGIDSNGDGIVPTATVTSELEKHAEWFGDGATSIYTLAVDALTALTTADTQYTDYEELLQALCFDSLYTKQDIIDDANASLDIDNDFGDDDDKDDYNKYQVDPNTVVVVSYGERAPHSNDKTVKKTFILNYNNYAVRITYGPDNVTYTIPAGGYVVV